MALAVAVGVAMLLATMAIINALGSQNSRGEWMSNPTPYFAQHQRGSQGSPLETTSSKGSIWFLVSTDQFEQQVIVRVDVAATDAHSLVPPGIPRLPGPGQFYASPALAALLRTTPASELGDRFSGTEIGTIGSSALPSPSDLIVVMGDMASTLAHAPGAQRISAFATSSGSGGPDTLGTTGLQVVLGILALVLLFPVLVFIAMATRLSAARREQRFAAMRLAGATLRQVAVIAAVEAVVAALAGVVMGFGLFILVKPALVHVPFAGQPLSAGDLTTGLTDILIVAIGVPFAAAVVARVALRRVRISPLGVTRRVTPSAPRFYRVIPLVAGIAILAFYAAVGRPSSSGGQIQGYLLGFFLIMIGLVLAGPWLTMMGSRIMAKRTSRATLLLAGRRLSDNPRGAFRAISGLILAIFVTSVAFGVISTLLTDHGTAGTGSAASETVADQFAFFQNGSVPTVPSSVTRSLHAIRGVKGVTLVHVAPSGTRIDGHVPDINGLGGDLQYGLVSCADLARTPALGKCQRGATFAALGDDIAFAPLTKSVTVAASTTWPSAHAKSSLGSLPVQIVAVATDGSTSTVARVETVLDRAFPFQSTTSLFGEASLGSQQLLTEMKTASEVVILASLLIAGCSLAVAMVSGVSERKRPFGLLRLTGVPLRVLQRVIALETAGPLVVIALVSATLGLVTSNLFLRSQLGLTLRLPGASYYAIVLGGLAGSLLIIGSTMPLLSRLTRPEDARME
ncbi:MAG: FtsX-like permease family protein [Acidimicrobiales bacterium]